MSPPEAAGGVWRLRGMPFRSFSKVSEAVRDLRPTNSGATASPHDDGRGVCEHGLS